MLLNKLYKIVSFGLSEAGDKISAQIFLNKEDPVFEGHFPGNPILPGVCTVQIVRELLEHALGKKLMLIRAGNIKYLGFISPVTTPEIQLELVVKNASTGLINCSATVFTRANTLCSFRGEMRLFEV